jgi:hypothetical protein
MSLILGAFPLFKQKTLHYAFRAQMYLLQLAQYQDNKS